MASDFRIFVHRSSDSLHLKLMGDFDASSAFEVLNILKKCTNGVFRVIIHTNSLKKIYPPGRDTFLKNLRDVNRGSFPILFTGKNACEIAPEKTRCL